VPYWVLRRRAEIHFFGGKVAAGGENRNRLEVEYG
jgi:hypothetical protein